MKTTTLITHADAAYQVLKIRMRLDIEEFWVLALGPGKSLLGAEMIFRGTVDACLIHPRDIFRYACRTNASSLIVAHNHPSGDVRPSEQDLLVTRNLVRAAQLFEIPVLDHLILIDGSYASFANERWGPFRDELTETSPLLQASGHDLPNRRLPSDRSLEPLTDDAALFQ